MPDEVEEIVVTGKREIKVSPVIQFSFDNTYSAPAAYSFFDFPLHLRYYIGGQTDFQMSVSSLTVRQRAIIRHAISRLQQDPRFKGYFEALLQKNANVNFKGSNRPDTLHGNNHGITRGLNDDSTVSPGATITITIGLSYGSEPVSDTLFAITVVHELLHALGVPSISALLDAPGSKYDEEIWRDLFRGVNLASGSGLEADFASVAYTGPSGGNLDGSDDSQVLVGSNYADSISPVGGDNVILTGEGDDSVAVPIDGLVDTVLDDGGSDRLIFTPGTDPTSITTRWSADESERYIFVNGRAELAIKNPNENGEIETVSIGQVNIPVSALSSSINRPPSMGETLIEYFGAFGGGPIGTLGASDPDGDALLYRLRSVTGAYAEFEWSVDAYSGVLIGLFSKPDVSGSEFSQVIVEVNDGIDVTNLDITVRWARSNEQNPEF